MTDELKTRCSAADREFHCAGPIGHEGPIYADNSDDARIGTVTHTGMANHVLDVEVDVDALADLAPDPDTVRIAFCTGVKIWRAVKPLYPDALTEMPLEGEITKGTTDLFSITYDGPPDRDHVKSIAIGDWKLADSGEGHPCQLRGYGAAAVDRFGVPSDGFVTVGEFWLLDGEYLIEQVSMGELEAFKAHMRRQHAQAGQQFSAGWWCKYCPIRVGCPAKEGYQRDSVMSFLAMASEGGLDSRETLAKAYDTVKLCRQLIEEYDKAVSLALADGPIVLDEKRTLVLNESDTITFPEPTALLEYLRELVNCDNVCRISKTALEREIRARSPRGLGAGRIRVLLAQLKELGLAGEKKTYRRKVVKTA